MSSLTRWVLAHKKIVVISWILLTIAGIAAAGPASRALNQKFSVPNKEGWETNQAIAAKYNGTGGTPPRCFPWSTLPAGESVDSPRVNARPDQARRHAEQALPGRASRPTRQPADQRLRLEGRPHHFRDRLSAARPQLELRRQPDRPPRTRRPRSPAPPSAARPVHVTGFDALQQRAAAATARESSLEALLGGFGALIVLAFVFASFLAVVPIMMAIASIMTTFLLLLGLTTFTDVSPIVQFLIALVGLGVAIDYSLLVVSRWREERAHGRAATRRCSARWRPPAGPWCSAARPSRSACSRWSRCRCRSCGRWASAGMLIPLVSTLVAITLLPVILAKFGQRLDWPHRRTDDKASRAWTRWAEARRAGGAGSPRGRPGSDPRRLVFAATNLQLGAVRREHDRQAGRREAGPDGAGGAPGSATASILPHEILVEGSDRPATRSRADARRGDGHPRRGRAERPRVAPRRHRRSWRRSRSRQRHRRRRHDTLDDVRDSCPCGGPGRPGRRRSGRRTQDFIDAVYGNFPLMIALIAIITFILLARAFRSLLLPLKAVILNVISVAAAWGVLALVWQHGHGSEAIWGIEATGSIPAWMPLMVFAFLFGLSMDYEVFILARMREEYDAHRVDTSEAVVQGHRPHRPPGDERRADPVPGVHLAGLRPGDRREDARDRPGRRDPARRDGDPGAARARRGRRCSGRWNWWLPTWPARLLRVEPSLPRGGSGRRGGGLARECGAAADPPVAAPWTDRATLAA